MTIGIGELFLRLGAAAHLAARSVTILEGLPSVQKVEVRRPLV
jgi:hypothetical protein